MKHLKLFENFSGEDNILFIRYNDFDNSTTRNKLPYDGIQCWAIYENDYQRYIDQLELWGGKKKNVSVINPEGYNINALNYTQAHKYVMGESKIVPELEKFNVDKHVLNFKKQDEKSMLQYYADLTYQIILSK